MEREKTERISELSRLARQRELTPAEQEERARLREEYLALMRGNLRSTLEQIRVQEPDGTITHPKPKTTNNDII